MADRSIVPFMLTILNGSKGIIRPKRIRKRWWGRRPFPAEAVATVPPDFEPDESPRHDLLKGYRPSVAVASLVTREALSTFFEPQTRLFSLITSYHISSLCYIMLYLKYYIFVIYSDFAF